MELTFAALIGLIAALGFYRYFRQRHGTPQQRVSAMLRQLGDLTGSGLSEREALLRLLLGRRGWKELPADFLGELIGRLETKESTLRFVTLAEDRGYAKDKLPAIANSPRTTRVEQVACLLSAYGYQLQSERRFKEAEFVQKLALALGPECAFTNLPLAATYFEMGRYDEAAPLFARGLGGLDNASGAAETRRLGECLIPPVDPANLLASYREKHAQCLQALKANATSA